MSTRSIIVVTGRGNYSGDRTIRLYKHSDGYPTGNLPLIAEALTKAKEQCDAENKRFESSKPKTPIVDQVVGLLIGASSDVYGMGARIDDEDEGKLAIYSEKLKPKHLGNQWDLEWIYIVDLNSNAVKIYGGGYTGQSPQHAYRKGMVDPMGYADQLKSEYQDRERQEIQSAINAIKASGFKVNSKRKRSAKVSIGSGGTGFADSVIPLKAVA